MDLFQCYQAFVRVVETGSFAGAGRQLAVSTSTISKRVQSLEEQIGVQLLHRTTRNLRVTDIGKQFYGDAVKILSQVNAAASSARAWRNEPKGTLRVTAPTSFGIYFLAPAIFDFQEQYKHLRIDLFLIDRAVNPVKENIDLCLQDVGERPYSMVERKLFPINRVLCASPAYLEQYGTPSHPHELTQHRCIHYKYQESGMVWELNDSQNLISVPIDPILTTNNATTRVEAAMRGLGIATVPAFMAAQALEAGTLRLVLPQFPFSAWVLSALYPMREHLDQKVRLFLDFLTVQFGPSSNWERQNKVRQPKPEK